MRWRRLTQIKNNESNLKRLMLKFLRCAKRYLHFYPTVMFKIHKFSDHETSKKVEGKFVKYQLD